MQALICLMFNFTISSMIVVEDIEEEEQGEKEEFVVEDNEEEEQGEKEEDVGDDNDDTESVQCLGGNLIYLLNIFNITSSCNML